MKSKTKLIIVLLSVSVIALSIFTIRLYSSEKKMEESLEAAVSAQKHAESLSTPYLYRTAYVNPGTNDEFVNAAEKTVNAVVHIRTEVIRKGNSYYDFFGPLLEQLYGGQLQVPNNVSIALGSGVVISPDGYIVTNNHVIEGASKIEVTFNDRHKKEATVVGSDPTTDLALIKVEGKDLEFLTFGDSDKVRVGEWALAVGNPFNLNSTVTAGIVSAKARNINILGDGSTIESFIQTDAVINPGNSGGALVDMEGNLIGINAAIASHTGVYEGYSFAIPSNIVHKVIEDFIQYGTLQRAYLGVSVSEVNQEIADREELDKLSGIYVGEIDENGAAAKAGIKKGDVIMSVNGITVNTHSELIGVISQYRPGETVKVKVVRKGETYEYDVVLKNMHGTEEIAKKGEGFYNERLGVVVQPLSAEMQKRLGISYGLKIVEVKDGVLKRRGIDSDFIILTVNNYKVSSEKDLSNAINNSKNGKTRVEVIDTDGNWRTIFEFYSN